MSVLNMSVWLVVLVIVDESWASEQSKMRDTDENKLKLIHPMAGKFAWWEEEQIKIKIPVILVTMAKLFLGFCLLNIQIASWWSL